MLYHDCDTLDENERAGSWRRGARWLTAAILVYSIQSPGCLGAVQVKSCPQSPGYALPGDIVGSNSYPGT